MNYYDDSIGTSPRWDRDWVKVLLIPDRYPQDMELLEIQQVIMSRLLVHTTAYEVVSGIKATVQVGAGGGKVLYISQGIIWCAIGHGSYVEVPASRVVIPTTSDTTTMNLGIELSRDVVGTGYDPILGGIHPLLWDAPLDRVRISIKYVWNKPDALPVLAIRDGIIYYYSDKVNPLRDTLMKTYMRELDGDYVVRGIGIIYHNGWVNVGAGKAWIGGHPIELEAQSIPYRDGLLVLCSDGSIAIETSSTNYVPEYSAIVSSEGAPILMGGRYGVVLPQIVHNPFLIPNRCIPIASLKDGVATDIAARLPTIEELFLLLSNPQYSNVGKEVGDINHPLYRARVSNYLPSGDYEGSGVIYLPRVVETIAIPEYIPPSTRALLEESTVRTDWIDSSPTPSTPPPPPPFIHASISEVPGEVLVRGYNLTPGATYLPSPAPTRVLRGTAVGASITADPHGMFEYISGTVPTDISGIVPTASPNLSIGLGQSFIISTGVMLGGVSIYLRAGYYGVISICSLQNNQPHGPALAWAPVSITTTGWVNIDIGPIYLQDGTYAVISQSVVGSVLGRRHYLLPTLAGTPETTGSLNMLLSQDGTWESLPNMDLMYRIYRSTPTSTYKDRLINVEWSEPFDGYEYRPNYHLAPGTYITCTASQGGTSQQGEKVSGPLLGKTFPPRTNILLSEALFGTGTLFPTIGKGAIDLYITSKSGTWISREELVGPYTEISVSLNAHIPEGTTVTVYVSTGSGWTLMPLSQVSGIHHVYYLGDLSPTTSSTDINGTVRQVIRERARIRIELSTISQELQPYVWNVTKVVGGIG